MVEERLAEAASVLKRLPEPRRQGYFNLWPEILHSFADKVGHEPKPMRVIPSPAAISRMEE
ncbi:helix-turn-helix domain-containing protein, partial [Chelatococcus daeguensis]|nr:helix-turn-helix domain-containing protein [Chelatococcus daeguensis]